MIKIPKYTIMLKRNIQFTKPGKLVVKYDNETSQIYTMEIKF